MQRPPHRLARAAACALVFSALLPGCVGMAYFGTERMDAVSPRDVAGIGSTSAPSAALLLERLGAPDERVQVTATREDWIYDRGLRWNGPVLFVVIPVPLLVPIGRASDTYRMEEGEAVAVDRVVHTETLHACGMFLHGSACRSWSLRDHVRIDGED